MTILSTDIEGFSLTRDGDTLRLDTKDGTLASVSLSDPSQGTSDGILAYRPNYADYHSSGLAGIFVNIEEVFPCTAEIENYTPVCSKATREEDGFMKGRSIIELGDMGNDVKVFGDGISTYGLAIQDCSELNSDCLPKYYNTEVVCFLPRAHCAPQYSL